MTARDDRHWKAEIPIVLPTGSEDRVSEVVRGLESVGATPAQLGKVLGMLMQGKAVDEHGDAREGVTVQPKEQLQAVRLAAEIQGMITRRQKIEQTQETVTRIRLERKAEGRGEIAGIDGATLRRLSAPARDELLKLLASSQPKQLTADDGNGKA